MNEGPQAFFLMLRSLLDLDVQFSLTDILLHAVEVQT
jgi:hypothetical protein